MAKSLLEAVNDIFKLANLIAGDADALTTLADSARQHDIDASVLALNQTIDELYSSTGSALPQQQAQSTITLALATRAYPLVNNFNRLHWPLIDKTNAQYIYEHKAGYDDLLALDPEGDNTGTPIVAVIRPTDSYLYIYPTPTAEDVGHIYTYQYDRDLELSDASDAFPFNNAVYRAVIPAAFQVWKRERRGEFDAAIFKTHLGRASRLLTQVAQRTDYCPR